jgi:hypothetical protein
MKTHYSKIDLSPVGEGIATDYLIKKLPDLVTEMELTAKEIIDQLEI